MKSWISLAAALMLLGMCSLAAGQAEEVSWELLQNAGNQGKFVQSDALGDTYAIEYTSGSKAILTIYDPLGDLINSIPLSFTPTGLSVDFYSGTAFVSLASGVVSYYWNGAQSDESFGGTVLAFSDDNAGKAVIVVSDSSNGVTRIEDDPYPDNGTSGFTLPYAASKAVVDSEGDVLVVQSIEKNLGNFTENVTFYTEYGQELWTRSYNHNEETGTYFANFIEDPDGIGYLITNGNGIEVGSIAYQVEAIDPNNGASDQWMYASTTGNVQLATADGGNVYLALSTGQLEALYTTSSGLTPGTVNWTINQKADQLTFNMYGPLVGLYSSSANAFEVMNYSSMNGAWLSGQAIPTASAGDEGQLICGGGADATYIGTTGGTSSKAVIAKLIYGYHLSKVVLPPFVVGGTSISADFVLTETPGASVGVTNSSNFPSIVEPPALVKLDSVSTPISFTTFPVNADTVVSITSTESLFGVRRFSTIAVQTAKLASIKPTATSVASGKTTTATITLNGAAGSAGKTILLSSNDPSALTLPASVSIGPGKTTAIVTLTAHAVAKNTVVTLTAKLGTQDVFGSLTVTP